MPSFDIQTPNLEELAALSDLQLRAKAYWGYDAAFMAACVDDLTLHAQDLTETALVVARDGAIPAGVAQVGPHGADADLLGMFVDPPYIGTGLGKALFQWAVSTARTYSDTRLLIEADPHATAFYRHMGAVEIGTAPSTAIPGRFLPLMEYRFR